MQDTEMMRSLMQTLAFVLAMSFAFSCGATPQHLRTVVTQWEAKLDARIGVLLRDISSDWEISYRADERFPMASTFKSLLCGAVLARVDARKEGLLRHVTYRKGDLVSHSPVTKENLARGMSIAGLCEATMTLSDNTAANLLLKRMGGPAALTNFLREIGDAETRLDRWETELNEAAPGDPRDTTTPRAILKTLEKLLFGDALRAESAAQLRQWMIDDQVADDLIRRHLPDGWVIGDKTGAGGHGSRGIVAFLSPPGGKTYLAAIYLTESDADFSLRNEVLADIGKAMIAEIRAN